MQMPQSYIEYSRQRLLRLATQQKFILVVFGAGLGLTTILSLLVSSYDIGFPLSEWLFRQHVFFSDWMDLYRLARYLPNPRLPQLFSPPVDMLGRFANSHMSQETSAVLLYFLPVVAGLISIFLITKNFSAVALVCLSYPFFFAVVRGNMEVHVFLVVFLALACLIRNWIAPFFLLIFLASLLKPFAIAFLAIAALDRPLKAAYVVAVSGVTNLGVLYLLGHSNFDAFPAYFGTARNYEHLMALAGVGDLYNNSLYTLAKIIAGVSNYRVLYLSAFTSLLLVGLSYFQACRAIGVFAHPRKEAIGNALSYGTIFYLPLFICFCISVSADYRLLYLTIPVFFLIGSGDYFFAPKLRSLLLSIYFLILAPKHFIEFGPLAGTLRFRPMPPSADVTLQSLINPVLMIVLCVTLGTGLKRNISGNSQHLPPID